ncbi:MAG: sugar phosphate nucleotidyltransferase [Steroidobacteraceae bacterium]
MEKLELLVLAGGFGTRLREAVADVPKPLAPVAEQPFLHYQMESWIKQGVTAMTFLLHHRADLIQSFLDSPRCAQWSRECQLRTVTEPRPLGTGGSIAYAVGHFGMSGTFLVTNADTWLGSGIQILARTRAPAIAVVRVEDSQRYGAVSLGQDQQIMGFEEKQRSAGPGWINAGLYHLPAGAFQAWRGQPFSLEQELFPQVVKSGQLVAAPLRTEFIDIGVPADYRRFCRWTESGRAGAL